MFSRSRFPPRENDEIHSHYVMVRGLVPSMSYMSVESIVILTRRSNVRVEPFYHGERIGSFHVRYEC